MAEAQTVGQQLNRLKYQDSRPATEDQVGNTVGSRNNQNIKQAQEGSRNQKIKALSSAKEAGKKAIEEGAKTTSLTILTTLWANVPTPLFPFAVIGLDIYLFFSLAFPQMTQFGEDPLGTPFGGGVLARMGIGDNTLPKIIEIILLMILNVILIAIVAIITLLIIFLAKLITSPFATLNDLFGSTWQAFWQIILFTFN